MRLTIEARPGNPVHERRNEYVECKGIGHPDTICDALVEAVSTALAQMYNRELGAIAHFNVDKALLAAGQCVKGFLEGELKQPMRFFLGDRATFAVGARALPVLETVEEAISLWLGRHLPRVRLGQQLVLEPVLAPGSAPLRRSFEAAQATASTDPAGAVGSAPRTPPEELVLATTRYLNSRDFKALFPDTGQDVKVFAVRTDDKVELTIAMPFFCDAIDSEATYFRRKDEVLHALHQHLASTSSLTIELTLNALDQRGRGADGLYLTLTGTSAEDADSGQVGRGNRTYGFIAFARPLGGEAAPGKNPIAHVGKIYSAASQSLAEGIHKRFPHLLEVYVYLAVRIGEPILRPWVSIQVVLPQGHTLDSIESQLRAFVSEELEHLPEFCQRLVRGEVPLY